VKASSGEGRLTAEHVLAVADANPDPLWTHADRQVHAPRRCATHGRRWCSAGRRTRT